MVSRYFFALCAVAMFVAVASISVEKEPRVTEEFMELDSKLKTQRSELQGILDRSLIDEIVRVLQEICSVAKNCLKDVTTECKKYWLIPVKFLQCVRDYIKENQDKCINPGFAQFY